MKIEIKFKIYDLNFLKQKLVSIKAKKISKKREHDFYFDTSDKVLSKRGILCRLRKIDTSGLLTIKGKKRKTKYFKIKDEVEIEVNDFQKAKSCLETLGFKITGGKEKVRELYLYKNTKICIDTLSRIGSYIEIEGTKRNIIEVSKKLGFNYKNGITTSYDKLLENVSKSDILKI